MVNDIFPFFYLYGYWIVFFGVMLDNVGLPIPGEIFVVMAGAFAGTGKMDFVTAALAAITGSVIGDNLSYYVGRWGGKRLIDIYCNYTLCTSRCSERVEVFYARFGVITIPVARFIMGVRTLAAPMAGAVRIAHVKFLILDAIGATAWTIIFLFTGVIFKNGLLDLMLLFEKIRYGFIVGLLFIIAAFVIFKLLRRRLLGRPDLQRLIQRFRRRSSRI
ncbi:MAG: DedA family protein [Nitrospirae bacterium]|nr:DedA family protein [Nitrospirota bacterium]